MSRSSSGRESEREDLRNWRREDLRCHSSIGWTEGSERKKVRRSFTRGERERPLGRSRVSVGGRDCSDL